MVLESVCHHSEVSDVVRGFKDSNDTGVVGGVGVDNINNLYCQFKCTTTLVPSYLDPDLVLWDSPPMPTQPATSVEECQICKLPEGNMLALPLVLLQQLLGFGPDIRDISKWPKPDFIAATVLQRKYKCYLLHHRRIVPDQFRSPLPHLGLTGNAYFALVEPSIA